MAATLTLNFDDKAAEGISKLVGMLKQAGDAASDASGEAEGLRDSLAPGQFERFQRTLIALNSGLGGQSEQVQELRKQYAETIPQVVMMGQEQSKLAQRMEFWANAITVYEFAAEKVGILKDKLIELTNRAIAVDRSLIVGAGIRAAIGYMTNLGTGVTGAYVAYKGLTGLMSSTGRVFLDIETGAEATSDAFRKMQNEARELGISVEKHIRNSGQTLEDFGVRVESNLNRQVDAVSKLAKESARPFMDFGRYFKAGVVDPVVEFTEGQWKEFDRQMTLRAGFFVENVGMMTTLVREFQAATVEAQGGSGEAYKREIELLEKQYEITEKLKRQNADNRDDFARARAINEAVENAISAEELQLRLRNANVEQIREEVQQTKEMMGKLAQQGRLDEELAKDMEGRLVWLAKRERELIAETAKARNDALLKTFEAQQRYAEEQDRKARQSVSDEMRQYQQDREDRRRADEQASKERMREIEAEVRERIQGQQRIREELRKTQEEERRNREARVRELATAYGGGMSGKDAKQQSVDIERNALQQIGQLRQQAVQAYVSGDVKGYMQSHQQAIQIYQQTLMQQKQLREKFTKDGNVLDQMKGQFGEKDVMNQVFEDRLRDARQKFVAGNKDGLEAFRKLNDGRSMTDDERTLANRFRRDAENMRKDVQRNFNRDVRQGRIGEDETGQAMNNLVGKVANNLERSGKLGKDQVDAIRQLNEVDQKNAEATQQQQELLKQVQEESRKTAEKLDQIVNDSGNGTARARRGAR